MRGTPLKIVLGIGVLIVVLTAASCGGGGGGKKKGAAKTGGTLVFAGASDPVVLDGVLVEDGESSRVIQQIFDTLVGLTPGGTKLVPALATNWKASNGGKTWTFDLRKGVKFQDGTPFNAQAVCFNFDRWYGFTGNFQNPDATYYWQTVFGGFKHTEPSSGAPKTSLFSSCKVINDTTVALNLTEPSSSFIGALTLPAFSFGSPAALKKYGANKGRVDADGVFHPTGTYATQHPIGTGPFMLKSWVRGDRLTLVRNPNYWGSKSKLDKLIFRPISDNAARLQALQTGEIKGYDLVEPQDIPTIGKNKKLKLLSRPPFNVGYVGFNVSKPPLNMLKVRQAVAHGLDRKSVVDSFYAGRGTIANEFMTPQIPGYAPDVKGYDYNPAESKRLLREAGLTLPVKLDFWYPTDISRPYMPDPKRNFEAFSASLEKSGFKIVPHSAPWSPDYLSGQSAGKYQMYLIGWTADFADADDWIGVFFREPHAEWGKFNDPKIMKPIQQARREINQAKRIKLYQQANRAIAAFIPGVPYASNKPAIAFDKNVFGYVPSPVDVQAFSTVYFGK